MLPDRPDFESLSGLSLGFQFGATILVFVGIGWWVDARLGTSPWILVLSVFLGFAGALYSLVLRVGGSERGPTGGSERRDSSSPNDR